MPSRCTARTALRAVIDPHLAKYRRDVCLDGRFGYAELKRDLLIQQSLTQHHQDAKLVRCERTQGCGDPGFFAIQSVILKINAIGYPYFTIEHRSNTGLQRADSRRFGIKPLAPC